MLEVFFTIRFVALFLVGFIQFSQSSTPFFRLLSGFLTVTNFLRNETLQRSISENSAFKNLSSILKQLVHRYLRLMPMQLLLILFVIVGFSYYREVTVFHISEPMDETCPRDWWQNLFLIQNFYIYTMCANWTWSLACDMQIHVFAILLLFLYVRYVQRKLTCLFLYEFAYPSADIPVL